MNKSKAEPTPETAVLPLFIPKRPDSSSHGKRRVTTMRRVRLIESRQPKQLNCMDFIFYFNDLLDFIRTSRPAMKSDHLEKATI